MFLPQIQAIYGDYTIQADFSKGYYSQSYYVNNSLQNLFWVNSGSWTSEIYNLTDFYVYGWETYWNLIGSLSGTLWIQFEHTGWNSLVIDPLNATVNTPLNGAWSFYFEFELNDENPPNTILSQFSLFIYANQYVEPFLFSYSFYIIIGMLLIIAILGVIYLKREGYI